MSNSNEIGIALIGCGAVGSEVARALLESRDEFSARIGKRLLLRHVVVRNTAKKRDVDIPACMLTADFQRVISDPEAAVVVELAGGETEAKTMVLAALAKGKDIVTANKALLAAHGPEVFAAARKANRCVAFEAAVAGGIPVIEAVRRGLIANRIDAILGILNGTCNYILTRMLETEASYAHALAEAQRLGYAEADPTLDVSGADSAHKLAIIASLGMRRACDVNRISLHGIQNIELTDLVAAAELGYACKLLAIARRRGEDIDLSVQPTFVPLTHPIANVGGPFNAVSVYGDEVGHTLYYGRGAGGKPTASAVLADVIDVAIGNARRTFEQLAVLPDLTLPATYSPLGESSSPFFIRVGLIDEPGGIGRIATLLGNEGISIATIVQHEPVAQRSDGAVPVVVTTHAAKEAAVRRAIEEFQKLDIVIGKPVCIPLLDEEME